MSILDDLKKKGAQSRLIEESLYAEVLREVESGYRRDGLWAKALSEAEFDEAKAKSLYIKHRVQALKDELAFVEVHQRELDGQRKREESRQQVIRENYDRATKSSLAAKYKEPQIPLETKKRDRDLTCNSCRYIGKMVWTRRVSILGWAMIIFFGGFPLLMVAPWVPESLWFNGFVPVISVLFGYFVMYLLVSKYEVKCPKCKNKGLIAK